MVSMGTSWMQPSCWPVWSGHLGSPLHLGAYGPEEAYRNYTVLLGPKSEQVLLYSQKPPVGLVWADLTFTTWSKHSSLILISQLCACTTSSSLNAVSMCFTEFLCSAYLRNILIYTSNIIWYWAHCAHQLATLTLSSQLNFIQSMICS